MTGRRLRGAVAAGVSGAATDAVLRVAHSFVARRALFACVAAAVVVGVADVAAMASTATVIDARASAASCFV